MKKGYITVFFVLVFMVFMSFILSVFEGIKVNAYRLKAECAYSAATNSVLGEYHKELLEMYDLFYVDTAYKTGVPDYHHVEAQLWQYLEQNIGISPELVEVNGILLATDNDGVNFRKQISAYMKDKIGVSYIEELSKLFHQVSEEGFINEDLDISNSHEKKWQDAMKQKEDIPEKIWENAEKLSGIETVCEKEDSLVLKQVIENESDVSKQKINQTLCVSQRECLQGSGSEKELDFIDKIYFIGYLFEKFSYYSKEQENRVLDYEVEYIIGNSGSDYENLKWIAVKLLAIRECMNLVHLLSDSEKMMLIKELSQGLSSVVVCPELAPVLIVLLVGFWSYAESVNDVKILFEGGKVPFYKTSDDWNTDLANGFGFQITSKQRSGKKDGLDYRQYLEILLLFSYDKKLTLRCMDLIEMNIQKTQGNENFRMDGLAEAFWINVVFDIPWFGRYQMVRHFGYGM